MRVLGIFLFLTGSICFIETAFAIVVPVGVEPSDVETVSKKFSGLLSTNSSNSPDALGADFELELTSVYQNLSFNEIDEIQTVTSEHLLEPILSLRKGLYMNVDMSLTFNLPVESQITSGYNIGLSHSAHFKSTFLKSEIYILNYTLNDILNISSSGLALVLYKKVGALYWGFGGRLESTTGEYLKSYLGSDTVINSGDRKSSFFMASALFKVFYEIGRYRSKLTIAYSEIGNAEAAFSIGFVL